MGFKAVKYLSGYRPYEPADSTYRTRRSHGRTKSCVHVCARMLNVCGWVDVFTAAQRRVTAHLQQEGANPSVERLVELPLGQEHLQHYQQRTHLLG